MCAYCNMGDSWFKYDPPWNPRRDSLPGYPQLPASVPMPVYPLPAHYEPWGLEKLREYHRLLKEVKDLEEKLGCPCEPNKADYVTLLEERIKALEAKQNSNTP